METDMYIMMHMLTGMELLTDMRFITLTGTATGSPRQLLPMDCQGFETARSETDGAAAFGMRKKSKKIFVGVSRSIGKSCKTAGLNCKRLLNLAVMSELECRYIYIETRAFPAK